MAEELFPKPPEMGDRNRSMRVQITYDAILDYMMANPSATIKEVASAFNYSAQGISIIVNADAFKAAFHRRKTEIVDPILASTVEDRLKGLAALSAERVAAALETSTDHHFALKVLETTTRAAGYGVQKPVTLENNFVVMLPGPAATSNEWSSKFAAPGAVVLKADVTDVPSEEVRVA